MRKGRGNVRGPAEGLLLAYTVREEEGGSVRDAVAAALVEAGPGHRTASHPVVVGSGDFSNVDTRRAPGQTLAPGMRPG